MSMVIDRLFPGLEKEAYEFYVIPQKDLSFCFCCEAVHITIRFIFIIICYQNQHHDLCSKKYF